MVLQPDGRVTDATSPSTSIPPDDAKVSIFTFAIVLLRWWRPIVGMGVAGAILGLTMGLTSARVYKSEAAFIPQGAETSAAAGLAAQFGLRPSTTASVWGPPIYVELLRSHALLEPIAADTFTVVEEHRKAPLSGKHHKCKARKTADSKKAELWYRHGATSLHGARSLL